MIIKNFEKLATSKLRRDALTIVEAGFEAIQTKDVIKRQVNLENSVVRIDGQDYDLSEFSDVYLFGVGKGSFEAVKALEDLLGERVKNGIVIDVKGGQLSKVRSVIGTHPDLSEKNLKATQEVMKMVQNLDEKSLIIFVICGGGSALLAAPFEISFQAKAEIMSALMNTDANIYELNVVRKHLDLVKGGRLAKLAYPAKVVSLIFSDVPGNDLSTIASGPFVLDKSTSEEAETILKKHRVWQKLSLEGLEFTESPKEEKYFEKVDNILMQDPSSVTRVMREKASELGWKPRILATDLQGKADEVGKKLLSEVCSGEALIASGETTVDIDGNGVGGRNQHLVLANLGNIKKRQVIIAAASDGHDHSDSAGAIGDETSLERAQKASLRSQEFLDRADSFEFFQRLGDSLDTGLLESNVADFYLVLQQ